jgi:hypothetical protein
MGRMKEIDAHNVWEAAQDALHSNRDMGPGEDCWKAFVVAADILSLGEGLAMTRLPASMLLKYRERLEAFWRVSNEVPTDRSERMWRMKRAIATSVAYEAKLRESAPDEAAFRRVRRDGFHRSLWFAPGYELKASVVDAALDAAIDKRRGTAAKRLAALHALARLLKCGSRNDESFRTAYARIKV